MLVAMLVELLVPMCKILLIYLEESANALKVCIGIAELQRLQRGKDYILVAAIASTRLDCKCNRACQHLWTASVFHMLLQRFLTASVVPLSLRLSAFLCTLIFRSGINLICIIYVYVWMYEKVC